MNEENIEITEDLKKRLGNSDNRPKSIIYLDRVLMVILVLGVIYAIYTGLILRPNIVVTISGNGIESINWANGNPLSQEDIQKWVIPRTNEIVGVINDRNQ